jgi:phage repressor protein C with HTH and peptisase S24 domain
LKSFESTIAEVLRRGVTARFHATGDSMHPTIRSGEHLHVAAIDARSLRVGDVVLARASRGLTAHRVVGMMHGTIVTRGDNALRLDDSLRPSDILGRITHVEREGATVTVQSAPLRIRVVARRLRRYFFSLSQLVRSFV